MGMLIIERPLRDVPTALSAARLTNRMRQIASVQERLREVLLYGLPNRRSKLAMIYALRCHFYGDRIDAVNKFFSNHLFLDKDEILRHVDMLASADNGPIWVRFICRCELAIYDWYSIFPEEGASATLQPRQPSHSTESSLSSPQSDDPSAESAGIERSGTIIDEAGDSSSLPATSNASMSAGS